MAGTQDTPLKPFIDWYVTDLEIMYACVIIDVYALFNNIFSLMSHNIYINLPEETCKTVETLMLLIRKYMHTLKDFPLSFLQRVLNRGRDKLSSKAASLLKCRYKEQVYFEPTQKDDFEDSLVGRIYASNIISCFDISPSEDYVICGYQLSHQVELFSLVDFNSLWTIELDFDVSLPSLGASFASRLVVFHPLNNVIFPGRLDSVINLSGKFEPGSFLCKGISPRFDNCCFYNDKSKMATIYDNVLTVWNLVNNEKLKSFSSNNALTSVLFSANGRFLATSDEGNTVVVYDLENDFISISKIFLEPTIFVFTFEADSWYCYTGNSPYFNGKCTVRSDLSIVNFYPCFGVSACIPLNVNAVAEFEDAIKNRQKPWLNKFDAIKFFCLDNATALVCNHYSRELELFRILKLKETPPMADDPLLDTDNIDISADGKFIYATKPFEHSLLIHKIDCNLSILPPTNLEWHENPFAPVANGVFFCGKLADRRYLSDIPELWNSGLTERLDSFPDLSGTRKCLPVSKEIVACIMDGKVCFLDIVERKVISETRVPQNMEVIACSSMYHVLMKGEWARLPPSLWRAGEVVAEWEDIFNKSTPLDKHSVFSPSGRTLALHFEFEKPLLIFNVCPAKLCLKVDFEFFRHYENPLGFLGEDHLLCRAYDTSMCIINVTSGNALTSIDCGVVPESWCVSRTPDNCSVLLCVKTSKKIKLMRVWLPRQTSVASSVEYCM